MVSGPQSLIAGLFAISRTRELLALRASWFCRLSVGFG